MEEKSSIRVARAEPETIIEVQTEESWEDITTWILENVWKRVCSLVRFIDRRDAKIFIRTS